MRTVTLLLAVLLGFSVAVSAVDLRQEAAGADSPRALLEQEVLDVRAETDELEDRRTLLEQEILEAQEEVLDGGDDGAARAASASTSRRGLRCRADAAAAS